jgi:cell division protein FtsW (lipid II flippase)
MDRGYKNSIDFSIVAIVLLLVIISIASVYSATYDAGASLYYRRQLLWAGIGIILMFGIMLIPFRTLQLLSYPLYGASLLVLVVILGVGKVVAGSKSW